MRKHTSWGWFYSIGLFVATATVHLRQLFFSLLPYLLHLILMLGITVSGQLWSLSTTTLQVRIRVQLNTILFAKTLVRKDVASSSASAESSSDNKDSTSTPHHQHAASADSGVSNGEEAKKEKSEEADFSSKAQIMTLMTTDVDRVSEFAWHLFTLIGSYLTFHSFVLSLSMLTFIIINNGDCTNLWVNRLANRDRHRNHIPVSTPRRICVLRSRDDLFVFTVEPSGG